MKCLACQAEIETNSVYCPKCGAKLEEPEGQEGEEQFGQEETQEPVSGEVDEQTQPEPAEQRTASQRLLDTARAGAEKTSKADAGSAWTQGGYSPKTLNARFLATCVASILLLVLSLWLWRREWGNWVWYPSLIAIAALWIWFACVRIYRVGTIKYQLTAHQFYHEEGIFKRVRDVIEVIDIDDLQLERTLWDRMINGGVGSVTIRSADQSSPNLKLPGLDNPDVVFQALDDARRKERAARGLKSV